MSEHPLPFWRGGTPQYLDWKPNILAADVPVMRGERILIANECLAYEQTGEAYIPLDIVPGRDTVQVFDEALSVEDVVELLAEPVYYED